MYDDIPLMLTVGDAGKLLHIGRNRMYEMVHAGRIQYIRNGKQCCDCFFGILSLNPDGRLKKSTAHIIICHMNGYSAQSSEGGLCGFE